MEANKRDEANIRARRLSHEAIERGEATAWFEPLYRAASGDSEKVPWADLKPNRWLLEWLGGQAVSAKDAAAVVVGCGLGDDAEELSRRGYDVTAFDVSPTAIDWAKGRSPETSVHYRVADLFELPASMQGAFDFVFEAYTIQALPHPVREVAIAAVADLVAPSGELLVVMRGGEPEDHTDGPPWPVTRAELAGYENAGLMVDTFDDFMDETIRRWRVHYRRPTA
jgi:SAM-dependent methyltransferase